MKISFKNYISEEYKLYKIPFFPEEYNIEEVEDYSHNNANPIDRYLYNNIKSDNKYLYEYDTKSINEYFYEYDINLLEKDDDFFVDESEADETEENIYDYVIKSIRKENPVNAYGQIPSKEITILDTENGTLEQPIYAELAKADTLEKVISFTKKYGALFNPYVYTENYKLYNINEGIHCHFSINKDNIKPLLTLYHDYNIILNNYSLNTNKAYIYDYMVYDYFSFYQKEIELLSEIKYELQEIKKIKNFEYKPIEQLVFLYSNIMVNYNNDILNLETLRDDLEDTNVFLNYPQLDLRYKIINSDIAKNKMVDKNKNYLDFDAEFKKYLEKYKKKIENGDNESFTLMVFSLYDLIKYCNSKGDIEIKNNTKLRQFCKLKNSLLYIIKDKLINLLSDTVEQCMSFYLQNVNITSFKENNNYKFLSPITAIFFLFYFHIYW